jgi:hypothetical protein
MHTSIVLLAMAGVTASTGAAPTDPSWQGSYAEAVRLGKAAHKPLAVFVGSGRQGWQAVSEDGRLSGPVKELLRDRYVCVYVDRSRPAGRELADSFEMPTGPGLVLSDHGGENQAFRHEGTLTNADLERSLLRYADPERVVGRTETVASRDEVRYYPPEQAAPPVLAPVPVFAPSFAPMGGFPSMGGFGGGGGRGGC